MKKKKIVILILIAITILQISIRIYIGNKKTYFHMDEAYSYGLMNYERLNIADNPDFANTWHNKEYYLDYLEINKNEKFNWKPVYENQKNDVHPPLFYMLLRIAASFSINSFTKWSGILLNIVIFALSNIFIFKISKRLFKRDVYGILACIINGFSLISLNANHYIRMYELANLATLSLSWFHLKIYTKEKICWKDLLPISASFILGGLIHYYVLIYGFGLYVIYTIKCIKNKQKNNFIKYQVAIISSAFIYLLIFPYSIKHVLFSYRGITQVKNNKILQLIGYIYIINKEFFNGLILIFIVALLCIYNYTEKNSKSKNAIELLLIIPILFYIIAVIFKAPYIEARYIMPIYANIIITILYGARRCVKKGRSEKETLVILSIIYAVILCSPLVTNTKLDFTYEQYKPLVEKIQKENKPIVYIFNESNNRFLDDIYLFTLADKSIITDKNTVDKYLKELENVILICQNEDIEDLKEKYKFNYKFLQNMNACNVYEINKKDTTSVESMI